MPTLTPILAKDFAPIEAQLRVDAQGVKMPLSRFNVIKGIVESLWDQYPHPIGGNRSPNKIDLAARIEHGLAFGEFAKNEHYSRKDILVIVRQVEAEKAAAQAPIVEVP